MNTKALRAHALECILISEIRDALADLEPWREKEDDADPECGHTTSASWISGLLRVDIWFNAERTHCLCQTTNTQDERERADYPINEVMSAVAFVRRHIQGDLRTRASEFLALAEIQEELVDLETWRDTRVATSSPMLSWILKDGSRIVVHIHDHTASCSLQSGVDDVERAEFPMHDTSSVAACVRRFRDR